MSNKVLTIAAGVAAAGALGAGAAYAHHSFGAEFDASQALTLEGTVAMFEWTNPHSWLHVDVVDEETGETVRWRIEGGAPSPLLRRGWNRDSLPPGTPVIVEAFPAHDGDTRAAGGNITFPDGRELYLGDPAAAAQATAQALREARENEE